MYVPDETRDTSVNATTKFVRRLRERQYELKDHLGNVRVVLSDLKRSGVNGINRAPWDPDVLSYSNYYPYGMLQPDRYWNAPSYRYGFNGKEKDDEVHSAAVTGSTAGEGNSYDYGFRVYDPRMGKFLSIDPLTSSFPFLSPLQFASNTPVQATDLDGREAFFVHGTTQTSPQFSGAEVKAYMRITGNRVANTSFSWDAQLRNNTSSRSVAAGQLVNHVSPPSHQ